MIARDFFRGRHWVDTLVGMANWRDDGKVGVTEPARRGGFTPFAEDFP